MAKITEMVGERVISGFRGTLDFYYYMGIPCVRAWPKSPGSNRSPAVQAGWVAFKEAAQLAKQLDPAIIEYYKILATGTGLTWKDVFFRSYMSGLEPLVRP